VKGKTSRPPQVGSADGKVPVYPIRTVAQLTAFSPPRTRGGHRLFSQEDVERLLWIKRMVQERGLSLQGVKRLLEAGPRRRR